MYPSGIGRVASIPFLFVLIIIIAELSVHQISASLYLEVTNENAAASKITLYECSTVAEDMYITKTTGRTPKRPKVAPTPTTATAFRKSGDIVCTTVDDKKKKQDIYSKANFFLVTNGELDGGKKILLTNKGKKGSRTPSAEYPPPYSFLFGVQIIGAIPKDYPKFTDASDDEKVIGYLTRKSEATPLIGNYLPKQKFEDFVDFLSVANYDLFLKPTDEVRKQFIVFSDLLKEVEIIYTRDVRNGKKNGVNPQRSIDIHQQVGAAVRLLIQKIVDPCLFLANHDLDPKKKIAADKQATSYCTIYCRFLGVGFLSNRVFSKTCGSGKSLVYGECSIYRCICERQWKSQILHKRKQWPSEHHDMVRCSNELRVGIAEFTPKAKTSALASLASIQKSFSNGWSRKLSRASTGSGGNVSKRFPREGK